MRPIPPPASDRADEPVAVWRARRLRLAGFSEELADAVAHDCGYDVHALLELVDRGCPAQLAVRILAPLDGPRPC